MGTSVPSNRPWITDGLHHCECWPQPCMELAPYDPITTFFFQNFSFSVYRRMIDIKMIKNVYALGRYEYGQKHRKTGWDGAASDIPLAFLGTPQSCRLRRVHFLTFNRCEDFYGCILSQARRGLHYEMFAVFGLYV